MVGNTKFRKPLILLGSLLFLGGNAVIALFSYEYLDTLMPRGSGVLLTSFNKPNGLNDDVSNSIGYIYGKFLVDTGQEYNRKWGNGSYRFNDFANDGETKKLEEFKEVTNGYSEKENKKSLNGACLRIYPKNIKHYEKYKSALGKYCSINGESPTTISSTSNDNIKDIANKLLATDTYSNRWFWIIKSSEFEHGALQSEYYDYRRESIEKKCSSFYNDSNSGNKPKKEEILKICGFGLPDEKNKTKNQNYFYWRDSIETMQIKHLKDKKSKKK